MLAVIGLNEGVCVEILDRLPRIVTVWVPPPLDEVLKSMHLTKEGVINDGLNFIFRVFVNEVGGRSGVIRSVRGSFFERGQ